MDLNLKVQGFMARKQERLARELAEKYGVPLNEVDDVVDSFLKDTYGPALRLAESIHDSVDYPDFGHPVATDVESGKADLGIVICGSGNGIAMTVNKHQGIRAALCWTKEISALARQHNNANIVSIPARFTSIQQAVEIVETFLSTAFEGGRHQNRVNKISC